MKKIAIVFFLFVCGLSVHAQDKVKKDNDKTIKPTALSFTQSDQNNPAESEDVLFFNVNNTRQNKNVSSQALLLDFRCPLNPINSTSQSETVTYTKQEDE